MDDITREFPGDAGGQPSAGRQRSEQPEPMRHGHGDGDVDRGSGFEPEPDDGSAVRAFAFAPENRIAAATGGALAAAFLGDPAATPDEPAAPLDDPQADGVVVDGSAGDSTAVDSPAADSPVDAAEAAAALAAAEENLEIDEVEGDGSEEGLPPVPELQDAAAVSRIVFVLLLTQREGLSLLRLAQACNTTQKTVEQALALLSEQLASLALPVELVHSGESVKFLSRPEAFPFLQRLRGVKRLEKLSPAALETLAVIAYRQPVMRAEIEAIRGVKAGPMLRTLLSHKLVRVTGRADVPGRPLQYGTTQQFLERFGLPSLQELPSVKEWKQLG